MNKKNKKIFIIISISVIGILFISYILASYFTEYHEISDYDCEKIDLFIMSGDCLPSTTTTFGFGQCFSSDKIYLYYKLHCIEK